MNKYLDGIWKSFCVEFILFFILFVDVFGWCYISSIYKSFIHRISLYFLCILLAKVINFLSKHLNWSQLLFLFLYFFILLLLFLFACFILFYLLLFWLSFFYLQLVNILNKMLHGISSSLHIFFILVDIIIEVYIF